MGRIHLDHVTKRYGGVVTAVDDVSLEIPDGEFVVLVGPSGCGKSTLLRMVAGLEAITEGHVYVGEKDVTDIPPRDRDIAMVFQNYALYPQMTVRQNLAFGLKVRRTPKAEINRRVDQVARTLRLDELTERRPGELSGGQRQRVAIGRAMVREPNAFLMDEPLSNLDAKLRSAMRLELAALHERLGVTTVFVTHDQVEAMTLGQRVAVLRDGTLQQYDTPHALFRHPANLFVATFIGSPAMNIYPATITDGQAQMGDITLALPEGSALRAHPGKVLLGIRPTDFQPAAEDPAQRLPRMTVEVDLVEDLGADINLLFNTAIPTSDLPEIAAELADSDDQLLAGESMLRSLARVSSKHPVQPGSRVELAVDIDRVHLFDPASGVALT